MWGLVLLALAGVGAILLAYSMGRDYERIQQSMRRHPAADLRWQPCPRCADAWGEPTACGFAGCLEGYLPRPVRDGD